MFVDLRERRLALAPRRDQLGLALLQRRARGGEGVAFGGDRVASSFDSELRRAQPADRRLHLVAELLDPVDHGFVHAVDPLQVFGAVDQLLIAVGADDHAQHVGGAGLVDRDQALAQGHQRAPQARPDDLEVLLRDVEFGDRFVELGLLHAEALLDLRFPPAQRGDLIGQPFDPVAVAGDRRRQHPGALVHMRELRFPGFELRAEIRAGAGVLERSSTISAAAAASSAAGAVRIWSMAGQASDPRSAAGRETLLLQPLLR